MKGHFSKITETVHRASSTEAAYSNKSPRGLNAHLNWRKLPVVHLGVCHQLEKLWGPSPGPHGAMCTIWTILNPLLQRMCFELDETVTAIAHLSLWLRWAKNSIAGYVHAVPALVCFELPAQRGEQFLWFLKIDLLKFSSHLSPFWLK